MPNSWRVEKLGLDADAAVARQVGLVDPLRDHALDTEVLPRLEDTLARPMRSFAKPRPGPAPGASASPFKPRLPALRAGRNEDEAALWDALHVTRSGENGPAGRRLLAWRALAAGSVGQWRSAITVAAEALDLPGDGALQAATDAARACARPPPLVVARTFKLASRTLRGKHPRRGRGTANLRRESFSYNFD